MIRAEAERRKKDEYVANLVNDATKKENDETRDVVVTKAEEVKEEVKAGVDTLGSHIESLEKKVDLLLESAQKIAAAPEAEDLISSKKELFQIETITVDESSGASLATQSEQDEEIARLKKENDLLNQRILNEKKRSQPQQEVAEEDAAESTRPMKKLKGKLVSSLTDRLPPLLGGKPKL